MRYVMTSLGRSGTHYVKAVLSRIIGTPPLEARTSLSPLRELPPNYDLRVAIGEDAQTRLVYDHFYFEYDSQVIDTSLFPDLGIIVLTRNPLDRLLSVFAYSAWKGLLSDNYSSYRDMARDWILGRNNGKSLAPNRIVDDYVSQQRVEIENYAGLWIKRCGGLQIKFEDLIERPQQTFRRMLERFELAFDDAKLEQVLRENSFDVLSGGRKKGEVDLRSHYRSGLIGEYKSVFSNAELMRIRDDYGAAFASLGYEI